MSDWKEKVEAAHNMVSALCKPRGSEGSREWIMSIPARPDYDPDLVITDGLMAAEKRIAELEALLHRAEHVPVKVRLDLSNPNLCIRQIMDCELTHGATREEIAEMILVAFEEHAIIDVPQGVPSVEELADVIRDTRQNYKQFEQRHSDITAAAAIRDAVLAGLAADPTPEQIEALAKVLYAAYQRENGFEPEWEIAAFKDQYRAEARAAFAWFGNTENLK